MRPNFLEEVRKGQKGMNEGLPNVFNRFNQYLYGTQKKTYYAIGGLPGSGKTGFADDNFILSPYFYLKDKNMPTNHMHWHYYSFEIDYLSKRAKWTSYRMYQKYNILMDSNYILSKGKNRVSDAMYQKVVAVSLEIDELFDHITFVDEAQNPTGIFRELMAFASKRGTFHYENYDIVADYAHPDIIEKGSRISGYTPFNPDEVISVVTDHMALAKREKGYDVKTNMDKLSEYYKYLRNRCGYIFIAVVQFGRGLTSIERIKFKKELLLPTLEDFKDTGNIGQDCNTALGMFNPFKMDFEDHLGYPILPNTAYGSRDAFEDRFRSINILKNRDGEEWRHMGMFYLGGLGMFRELPMPNLFESGIKSVSSYMNVKSINTTNYVTN